MRKMDLTLTKIHGAAVTFMLILMNDALGAGREHDVIRPTAYGNIRGYVNKLSDGTEVERYLGIPYGAPPVGERRFAAPVPPIPWTSTRNASSLPPACVQALLHALYIKLHNTEWDERQSEDCLYLNVYVPRQTPVASGLPVLVHVHGGSNEVGMGAMFHGDVLASQGSMVVVTLNYRLSIFGFLSLPHIGIPGNYGLQDQILALQWVKDNIANFGGDPGKVTLQGHSAGSVDVGLLLISPLAKGLFRYAILQSGSPLAYWAIHPTTDQNVTDKGPMHHLKQLGCHGDDPLAIKQCLWNLNYKTLANQSYLHGDGFYGFSAVVDGNVVPELPGIRMGQVGGVNADVVMTGLVTDEGSHTTEIIMKMSQHVDESGSQPTDEELMNDESQVAVPDSFDISMYRTYSRPEGNSYMKDFPHYEDLVFFMYNPWTEPHNVTSHLIALSELVGDLTFTAPAVKAADKMAASQGTRVFMYSFEYLSEHSAFPRWMGVPHGEDLFYLFGAPLSEHARRNYTSSDVTASREFIKFWASFVRTGEVVADNNRRLPSYGTARNYVALQNGDVGGMKIQGKQGLRTKYAVFWNELMANISTSDDYGDGMNNELMANISSSDDYDDSMNTDTSRSPEILILVVCVCLLLVTVCVLLAFVLKYKQTLEKSRDREYPTANGDDTHKLVLTSVETSESLVD